MITAQRLITILAKKILIKILYRSTKKISSSSLLNKLNEDKLKSVPDNIPLISRLLTESIQNLQHVNPPHIEELHCDFYNCSKVQNCIKELLNRCADVIINTSSPQYTWGRKVTDQHMNDLDSTCNAVYTLLHSESFSSSHNPNNISTLEYRSELISNLIQNLLHNEQRISNTRSAYRTWIVQSKKSEIQDREDSDPVGLDLFDIDPVVQVIVYKVLSSIRSVPKNLERYIEAKLSKLTKRNGLWDSKLYTNPLYVLAELSSLPLKSARIFTRKKLRLYSTNNKLDYLDTILLLQCRLNTGYIFNIRDLLGIIFIGLKVIRLKADQTNIITLTHYIKLVCSVIHKPTLHKDDEFNELKKSLCDKTKTRIAETISLFDDPNKIFECIFKSNNHIIQHICDEILELFYSFKRTSPLYLHKFNSKLTSNTLDTLIHATTATSYCWVSYTIYDSIIDKEIDARLIPIANSCLHKMDSILNTYRKAHSGITVFDSLFIETNKGLFKDAVLSATTNTYSEESSHIFCKSIAHCVGPIILFNNMFPTRTNQDILKHFISFYRNLLSARQLSDDAHDWETDMGITTTTQYIDTKKLVHQSRYTPVTNLLFKKLYYAQKHTTSRENLNEIFKQKVLRKIFDTMKGYSNDALINMSELRDYIPKGLVPYWLDKVKKYKKGISHAMLESMILEKLNSHLYSDFK